MVPRASTKLTKTAQRPRSQQPVTERRPTTKTILASLRLLTPSINAQQSMKANPTKRITSTTSTTNILKTKREAQMTTNGPRIRTLLNITTINLETKQWTTKNTVITNRTKSLDTTIPIDTLRTLLNITTRNLARKRQTTRTITKTKNNKTASESHHALHRRSENGTDSDHHKQDSSEEKTNESEAKENKNKQESQTNGKQGKRRQSRKSEDEQKPKDKKSNQNRSGSEKKSNGDKDSTTAAPAKSSTNAIAAE